MCGIALSLSGVQLKGHLAGAGVTPTREEVPFLRGPSISDLCEALKRRGPDNLDTHTLFVRPTQRSANDLDYEKNSKPEDTPEFEKRAMEALLEDVTPIKIELVGASLQLRGNHPVPQPIRDSAANLLIYNGPERLEVLKLEASDASLDRYGSIHDIGEIFGGLHVRSEENDTEVLMAALRSCCCCPCHATPTTTDCPCAKSDSLRVHKTVPELLSCLRGPWALVFWQAKSQILWFGRDMLGRRSLLLHRPSESDARLLLASVAPAETLHAKKTIGDDHAFEYWEELPCGIHSIGLNSEKPLIELGTLLVGVTQLHEWEDPLLLKLIAWDRRHVDPNSSVGAVALDNYLQQGGNFTLGIPEDLKKGSSKIPPGDSYQELDPVLCVLKVLRNSVRKRTSDIRKYHKEFATGNMKQEWDTANNNNTPVAILFSGGLDSMILAALADECLPPHCAIDLLNVSFEGATAPDRVSAIAGLAELQRVSPFRRWRLVKVDSDLRAMNLHRAHLMSLICPSNTFMDLNIGTALWLAAGGIGYIEDAQDVTTTTGVEGEQLVAGTAYASKAQVLLVGAGADEQCGGYGRHRTRFRLGGWEALQAEMRIDMQRIWKRNLGRDDRCMADLGKEARFPFLDEEVVETLLDMALWDIVDLQQPIGHGDKKILRQVAMRLGLTSAASLPKRAIQFGSRIARESNKREFGSNRAANQASAGSAVLPGLQQSSQVVTSQLIDSNILHR